MPLGGGISLFSTPPLVCEGLGVGVSVGLEVGVGVEVGEDVGE